MGFGCGKKLEELESSEDQDLTRVAGVGEQQLYQLHLNGQLLMLMVWL